MVAQTDRRAAVRTEHWKLVFDLRGGSAELYNLRADPGETLDLAGERRGQFAALRNFLAEWRQGLQPVGATPEEPVDPDTARQLQTLGYAD